MIYLYYIEEILNEISLILLISFILIIVDMKLIKECVNEMVYRIEVHHILVFLKQLILIKYLY
jgi:hypothetical protein